MRANWSKFIGDESFDHENYVTCNATQGKFQQNLDIYATFANDIIKRLVKRQLEHLGRNFQTSIGFKLKQNSTTLH